MVKVEMEITAENTLAGVVTALAELYVVMDWKECAHAEVNGEVITSLVNSKIEELRRSDGTQETHE